MRAFGPVFARKNNFHKMLDKQFPHLYNMLCRLVISNAARVLFHPEQDFSLPGKLVYANFPGVKSSRSDGRGSHKS